MNAYMLSNLAARDLDEIWQYVALNGSVAAADNLHEEFLSALRKLSEFPRIGHSRKDLTRRPLLFWPVYSYLVLYDPALQPLGIARVIHGARDVKRLLKNMGPLRWPSD